MKKKFLALALTAVMALSLAACGGDTQSTDTDADTSGDESASGSQTYTVGIIQQVQHEALDAATQGFQDALTELLGDSVTIDPQNASGDTANCTTIANNFVSQGVDLIMANGTTALQAAATGTSTIPILGTSITEYGVALGIDGFTGTTGYNVSGTSDLAPLDQQAEMLHTWFPDAQTVGLLYCSAEPNSQYQVDTVQGYLEDLGYTCHPILLLRLQRPVRCGLLSLHGQRCPVRSHRQHRRQQRRTDRQHLPGHRHSHHRR